MSDSSTPERERAVRALAEALPVAWGQTNLDPQLIASNALGIIDANPEAKAALAVYLAGTAYRKGIADASDPETARAIKASLAPDTAPSELRAALLPVLRSVGLDDRTIRDMLVALRQSGYSFAPIALIDRAALRGQPETPGGTQ